MTKSESKKKKNQRPQINNLSESIKQENPGSRYNELQVINISIALLSLFIALVFSYFVYFSHQLTEVQSEMYSNIVRINAISPPFPWGFMTIKGHKEYYYLKRREQLFNEFRTIKDILQRNKLDKSTLSKYGNQLQILITQIAYFFPYKRMLDFQKDGSVKFDPNRFEAIETAENIKTNIPGYAVSPDSDRTYDPKFITTQLNHINESHRRFTLELKDCKEKIIEAMILANKLNTDHDKKRLSKYIDGLIDYLENHYVLSFPLGLSIIKYDFIKKKLSSKIIIALLVLMVACLVTGVILPIVYPNNRNSKICTMIVVCVFVIGVAILINESLYSFVI